MRTATNGSLAAYRRKHRRRHNDVAQDLKNRLSRAEGQLRGIRKMMADGAYCIDLLQQLAAVRRALDKSALVLVRDHLETCVAEALAERDAPAKIAELIEALDRFLA
jgi:CsoR family transcriptional regulator, copper-sensing transcriptional repressor